MSNRLLVNPGTPEAWAIDLKPGVNRIGRTPDNEFVIGHQSISTHHCEITVGDGAVTIKDLNSTNGTFVEKVPITETALHHGQRLQLGAVAMVFESKGLPVLPDAVNLPADGARIMVANPTPAPPPVPAAARDPRGAAPHTQILRPPFDADPGVSDQKSLLLGTIGAVGAGLIGMFIWYFLIRLTEFEIGWVAWGVGGITGFGARMVAKRGAKVLGIICGACSLVAILGGTYLAALHFVNVSMKKLAEEKYTERQQFAQSAVAASTDEELRALIASENEEQPAAVTEEMIKQFKSEELPQLQEFLAGHPSKDDYVRNLTRLGAKLVPRFELFKESISAFTLLWLFLGVGTAYKIGSGHND